MSVMVSFILYVKIHTPKSACNAIKMVLIQYHQRDKEKNQKHNKRDGRRRSTSGAHHLFDQTTAMAASLVQAIYRVFACTPLDLDSC